MPIRPAVIQNLVNLAQDIKARVSPEAFAGYDAVVKALLEPDSLIQITFTSAEQLSATLYSLLSFIKEMDILDNEKMIQMRWSAPRGQWPIVELVNGSGIKLVMEKKS